MKPFTYVPTTSSRSMNTYRIHYTHPQAITEFSKHLTNALFSLNPLSPVVCLCIGTDRSTGDALGPLVGSKLQHLKPKEFTVLGTLEQPVHAVNLEETLRYIAEHHADSTVIAVDACLGQLKSVGEIHFAVGPLKPGAGVNKKLPEVGQLHITGIVNVGGFMEYFVLQNTRLGTVMKMADTIASALYLTDLFKRRHNRELNRC